MPITLPELTPPKPSGEKSLLSVKLEVSTPTLTVPIKDMPPDLLSKMSNLLEFSKKLDLTICYLKVTPKTSDFTEKELDVFILFALTKTLPKKF